MDGKTASEPTAFQQSPAQACTRRAVAVPLLTEGHSQGTEGGGPEPAALRGTPSGRGTSRHPMCPSVLSPRCGGWERTRGLGSQGKDPPLRRPMVVTRAASSLSYMMTARCLWTTLHSHGFREWWAALSRGGHVHCAETTAQCCVKRQGHSVVPTRALARETSGRVQNGCVWQCSLKEELS